MGVVTDSRLKDFAFVNDIAPLEGYFGEQAGSAVRISQGSEDKIRFKSLPFV